MTQAMEVLKRIDAKQLDKQLTLICELVSYHKEYNLKLAEKNKLAGLENFLSELLCALKDDK